MSQVTVKGSLKVGVEFKGEIHKEFELRPAQVRDSIAATEMAKGNQVRMLLGLLVGQLESLGTIPKEAITMDLLSSMYDVDLEVLQTAREDVEKKLLQPSGI